MLQKYILDHIFETKEEHESCYGEMRAFCALFFDL